MLRALALCAIGSVASLAGFTPASTAEDRGFPPAEAAARMKLPPGFQVQVFASEPEIRQPVAACFDARGRLWVIEYLQYPAPAGLKPVTVDQYLRTEYDRVPEPPPRGPRGADRIKILEDTDGDGQADKVATFVEGLNLASALAVGHGGVFVGQAPYLLFYPDRDHDDRPDGDPEVLLSGFGLQDAHATVNSLAWGPDGWLYGAQGSTVTAKIRGIEFQQAIWRYHPPTRRFELFAEGGGNTWGLDFDPTGHAFGSSNGGFVAFHMEQGGYYWKGFAKHGPLHNPRAYGYFDCLPFEGPKPGGHVTPGGIIYQGSALGPELQNAFIGGNLLSNAVYAYTLSPQGSSFRIKFHQTLIDARDSWFRPVDLLSGPDGALYVVDWYDRRASHLDPRDNWDKSNGRIYRFSKIGQPPARPAAIPSRSFDLEQLPSAQLANLMSEANAWWPREALRILWERRDHALIPHLQTMLDPSSSPVDSIPDVRRFWALAACGGVTSASAHRWLEHPNPAVRRWAIRLLGDDGTPPRPILDLWLRIAQAETDPAVRAQLACSATRIDPIAALPILRALGARPEDSADPHIPLLVWWGIERALQNAPGEVVESLQAHLDSGPILRDVVAERLARALASNGTEASLALVAALLKSAASDPVREKLLNGLEQGLLGNRVIEGTLWPRKVIAALEANPAGGDPALRLRILARLGDPQAYHAIVQQVTPSSANSSVPSADFIEILGQMPRPEGAEALFSLVTQEALPANTRLQALRAIAAYPDPRHIDRLLERAKSLPAILRGELVILAMQRPAWTERLIAALERGALPTSAINPAQAQKLAQNASSELAARFEAAWGRVPRASVSEKSQRVAEIRGILPEGDKGDPARGKLVFQKTCAGCHVLFGEGQRIGPELTGTERGNLEFLIQSVIDPSAVIRKEYSAEIIALADGRILSGLILDENDRAITLFDSQQQKTLIPRAEIQDRKASETSLMPENILEPLSDAEIRDLFRYLQSSGP
jgi:putative membrane-bound dehydrogenase-like protein